jgi:hypothetical protein
MANSYLSTRDTQWPTTGKSLSASLQLCDGLHSLESAVKDCVGNRHYGVERKLSKLKELLEKLNKFFTGYQEGKKRSSLTPSKLRVTINTHISQLQKAATLKE